MPDAPPVTMATSATSGERIELIEISFALSLIQKPLSGGSENSQRVDRATSPARDPKRGHHQHELRGAASLACFLEDGDVRDVEQGQPHGRQSDLVQRHWKIR